MQFAAIFAKCGDSQEPIFLVVIKFTPLIRALFAPSELKFYLRGNIRTFLIKKKQIKFRKNSPSAITISRIVEEESGGSPSSVTITVTE
jgi:hypothetical protein